MGGDGGAVLGRRVADVRVELPAWMALGSAMHVAVPRDLGYDGRRRDGCAAAVTVDHGALLEAEVRDAEAVDEADRVFAGDREQGGAERVEVGHVKSASVDATHAARDHGDLGCGPEDVRIQLFTPLDRVLLRVVETREGAALGQGQPL